MPLTPKQALFVAEYLIDFNGTKAAIRAKHPQKTAAAWASETLRKPHVAAALTDAIKPLLERREVTADRVLAELAAIGFANMADYMRVGPDGDPTLDFGNLTREQAAALCEVTVEAYVEGGGDNARDVKRVKFKLAPKLPALVKLGERLGLFKAVGAAPLAPGPSLGKKAAANAAAVTAAAGTDWSDLVDEGKAN